MACGIPRRARRGAPASARGAVGRERAMRERTTGGVVRGARGGRAVRGGVVIVHLLRRGLRNHPIAPAGSVLLALATLRWGEMALLMGFPVFVTTWSMLATSRAT